MEKVSGEVVSANFFSVLGVVPALGRTFTWDENRPERQPQVAVLSHRFWESHFHAKNVLGSVIQLNREPFVVIGVLSKGYRSIYGYGIAPEIYVPIDPHLFGDLDNPDEARLELLGRLKDGVSVSQAQASLYATVHRWQQRFPAEMRYAGKVRMYPLTGIEKMRQDGVPVELAVFFAFLLLVAVFVLLIACANVAGLLVARGFNRSREIAVRLALGAARYRLVQQLLTESLALALLGSGAGIAIYVLASKLIDKIQIRASVPMEFHFALDTNLIAVAIALALVATVLSGLTPALQTTKSRWHLGSNQIGAETRWRLSLLQWLVAAQFAFASVLLVSAALSFGTS